MLIQPLAQLPPIGSHLLPFVETLPPLNVTLHNMTIKETVDAPRFHSQWMPDVIDYEKNSLSKKVISDLEKMGHMLEQRGRIGEANGIMIDRDGFWGGADKRGENTAIGY